MSYRIFQYTDEMGVAQSFDITHIIEARIEGVSAAWEFGCDLLSRLIRVMPHIEGRHAVVKAEAYQRFKQIPVNKKPELGPVNPGTDSYFKDQWLGADEAYRNSRVERDQIRAMIEVLKQTYLPRLRMMNEEGSSAERQARSSQYSGMGRYDGTMPDPPSIG